MESMKSWLKWVPTSEELLEKAELKMFETFHSITRTLFVTIGHGNRIRTIAAESDSEKLPLVLIHGFGSGIGLWGLNLDSLAEKRNVYAIDLLGFGRSSRPKLPGGTEAEKIFIQSIEDWRREMGIDKFILLGHSFGGYLSASYAMSHPSRVHHLILADPWGMPEKTAQTESLPLWARSVASFLSFFNPLAAIRGAGPGGPALLRKMRPDLDRKFNKHLGTEDTRVTDYIYHSNAQRPSGETAFMSLTIPYGWAKFPIVPRVNDIPANLPISIIFGSRSWMDVGSGNAVKQMRPDSHVHVKVIKGAGHHVYADRPLEFNAEVNSICDQVDMAADQEFFEDTSKDDELNGGLNPT